MSADVEGPIGTHVRCMATVGRPLPFVGSNGQPEPKRVRFRNYLPESADLRATLPVKTAPAPAAVEEHGPSDPYSDELVRLEREYGDGDVVNVVPKDPTWDLKRDLEPKLAILARRTQRAIVDLIRERLSAAADDE